MLLSALLSACPDLHSVGNIQGICFDNIEYDSRSPLIGKNTMFVCMAGARVDGHVFAAAVYEKGCRIFVCSRQLDLPEDALQLISENPRRSLAEISAAFYGYPTKELTIIGITGTKGKTTTAILLMEILNQNGLACAYIGSNGVRIGDREYETVNTTPESRELHKYFRMMVDEGITHVVMEVSSQALQHWRVYGVSFDTCMYTNLSRDHIGGAEHASFEEYKECKSRLFRQYGCKHIVTNTDDGFWRDVSENPDVHTVTYAIEKSADFQGSGIQPFRTTTALGIDFSCLYRGELIPVRLRTPGDFSVYNGLCAIAAASVYGISPERCAAVLRTLSIRGRFEIVDALDGVTFLIDYAHNGLSLENALSQLRRYAPGRLICLFGSVGGRTWGRRRELAEVASALADFSIITSDNPDGEPPEDIIKEILSWFDRTKPYTVIPDREEAIRMAVQMAREGDIILLAGKGHETYQLVHGVKVPFSEREILLDEAELVRKKLLLS